MEYLENSTIPNNYKDLEKVEDLYINQNSDSNILDEVKVETNLVEISNILRQFLEASTFGDFHVRINLLKSFELFIHKIDVGDTHKKEMLIYTLHNLQIYYNQFSCQIEGTRKSVKVPIEKKLKEFVKIESYNKDLSYFSMRNNISRVHRNLNKFLKEYENQLNTKITSVFQPEDANILDLKSKTQFINQIIIDNFIVPVELNKQSTLHKQKFSTALLNKIDNLIVSSKKVVEDIIKISKYPEYITKFQCLFNEQIDNYEYLHELKVK